MAQTDWWTQGVASVAGAAEAGEVPVLGANKNLDVLAVADLKLGSGAGTSVAASGAELNLIDGSVAGTVVASKAVVVGANKEIDTIAIAESGLKIGAGAGTAVSCSAAELNLLDGSVAGTAVASKALALGADKNVDTLAIAEGGLKIGAGAGTAMSASAAELNLADGSVAGTAVASKLLCLGADKNVDVLAIADGGLKLGAGAGTAVNATAAELNAFCDQSAGVQAITGAAAITADGTINRVTLTGGAYAFTLAVPGAAAVGKFLCIEYIGGDTDADTLSLANVTGGSAATTASFNADGEGLLLFGTALKWVVVKEFGGVTMS